MNENRWESDVIKFHYVCLKQAAMPSICISKIIYNFNSFDFIWLVSFVFFLTNTAFIFNSMTYCHPFLPLNFCRRHFRQFSVW